MNREPPAKRAVAFVDGQNLFHAAREAFGNSYPNYDVSALAEQVCAVQGWERTATAGLRLTRVPVYGTFCHDTELPPSGPQAVVRAW